MDIQKMLKEAQALQKSLSQAQAELANTEVKGIAGGGLVEILMTANGELKNVKIKEEAVKSDEVETLEDLILSAFKDAGKKISEISQEKLKKFTGGKDLPLI